MQAAALALAPAIPEVVNAIVKLIMFIVIVILFAVYAPQFMRQLTAPKT